MLVGPTVVYAYMQAIGTVTDHLVNCYRYRIAMVDRLRIKERAEHRRPLALEFHVLL
jgi:hypothetical protein